jgi:hypothetical protein
MKKNLILATIIAAALAGLAFLALGATRAQASRAVQSGAPGLVSYQGYLTDDAGAPISGTADLQFGLYDAPSGGSPLWEETQGGVPVVGGYFAVLLGSANPLSAALFDAPTRYLEVRVDAGDGQVVLPRQQLAAVPYALQAEAAANADTLDGLDGSAFWRVTGNAGTLPGAYYLGTSDATSLTLAVSGTAGLRLSPNTTSPNLIGGYGGNSVAAGVAGATIGGGGAAGIGDGPNRVSDDYGVVAGGVGNEAGDDAGTAEDAVAATVGGGYNNTASGNFATIGGGYNNTASDSFATIGGGDSNTASDNYVTIGGGYSNTVIGLFATIGGGYSNIARHHYVSVGGGSDNTARGAYATIPGGQGADASHYGEMAYASGRFASAGDAQTSLYVLRNETGDATPTELFLDGLSQRLTVASGRVMTFDILIVAAHRYGGSSAGYQITGVIRNIGGTTSFIGTSNKTVLGEDNASWDVDAIADDANDALVVQVTGSNATTIRWVATARTVEVGR